jgi:hypothetical protein
MLLRASAWCWIGSASIGAPPFDPRAAVRQFCDVLKSYRITKVTGDAFAGQTFRKDFEDRGVGYEVRSASASLLYERFEPLLNAGEVEQLDVAPLVEQLITLIWRGNKITHEHGAHDDFANAAVRPRRRRGAAGRLFDLFAVSRLERSGRETAIGASSVGEVASFALRRRR